MHILANMRSRSAPYNLKVCYYLSGDKGGGESRQTVTKCDKGGGGSKIGVRLVTYFLNGPFVTFHRFQRS